MYTVGLAQETVLLIVRSRTLISSGNQLFRTWEQMLWSNPAQAIWTLAKSRMASGVHKDHHWTSPPPLASAQSWMLMKRPARLLVSLWKAASWLAEVSLRYS